MTDGPEWFSPKQYGYGSGLPIRWQGWALVAGFLLLLVLASLLLLPEHVLAYMSVVVMMTSLLLLIAAKTTRGGWRWRSGEKD